MVELVCICVPKGTMSIGLPLEFASRCGMLVSVKFLAHKVRFTVSNDAQEST